MLSYKSGLDLEFQQYRQRMVAFENIEQKGIYHKHVYQKKKKHHYDYWMSQKTIWKKIDQNS